MEQNILSVSELNGYIKFLFDRDEHLTSLAVRGEISIILRSRTKAARCAA